mmetsp:Transcript_99480/g.315757  ORF Transcript_99480/g.315757 Transcript_99480/m.315757 type:complete len:227 (-) Transcript_99480:770-1450(-)
MRMRSLTSAPRRAPAWRLHMRTQKANPRPYAPPAAPPAASSHCSGPLNQRTSWTKWRRRQRSSGLPSRSKPRAAMGAAAAVSSSSPRMSANNACPRASSALIRSCAPKRSMRARMSMAGLSTQGKRASRPRPARAGNVAASIPSVQELPRRLPGRAQELEDQPQHVAAVPLAPPRVRRGGGGGRTPERGGRGRRRAGHPPGSPGARRGRSRRTACRWRSCGGPGAG